MKHWDLPLWFATWLAGVLLAMESHDVVTGLEFDAQPVPEDKARKLKQACAIGQVTVTVPNPEPYMYLVKTVKGHTADGTTTVRLQLIRGVILDRPASWYGKRRPIMPTKLFDQ